MNKLKMVAVAALSVVPSLTLAQDAPPKGAPPQAVLTQKNLGAAGLLSSFYSGSQYGTTRARTGENASRIGAAGIPGAPADGYKHESLATIGAITGRKMLSDRASYLTFSTVYNKKNEFPNQTEFDTTIPSFTLGYQNFSNVDTAYGVYLSYAARESVGETVLSKRKYLDLRFDVAHKLSEHWGVTGRLVHSTGDLELDITTPSGTLNIEEPQTVWYGQAELVGNFRNEQMSAIPAGWSLHPVLGVSHDIETNEVAPGVKETSKSGSVWAKATLSKGVPARWRRIYRRRYPRHHWGRLVAYGQKWKCLELHLRTASGLQWQPYKQRFGGRLLVQFLK